jgi:hypothetical protein
MLKLKLLSMASKSIEIGLSTFLIITSGGCSQSSSSSSYSIDARPSVNITSSPPPSTDLSQGFFNLKTPSKWEGVAEVKVGDRIVKHPVLFEISSANSQGRNPFNFYIIIGDKKEFELASVFLLSGRDITTSSGGSVFLEYYQIQTTASGFQASLTKEQQITGTSINSFVGPMLSANPGNPINSIIEREREATGNKVNYIFHPGMKLTVNYQQGILIGKISGIGFNPGIGFTAGDLPCQVVFQVKRVT